MNNTYRSFLLAIGTRAGTISDESAQLLAEQAETTVRGGLPAAFSAHCMLHEPSFHNKVSDVLLPLYAAVCDSRRDYRQIARLNAAIDALKALEEHKDLDTIEG